MGYEIDFSVRIPCIDYRELLDRLNSGKNIIVVDTVGSYGGNRFKIKGSITIPYPEVINRREELVGFDEVIIYCKNRDCKASKKVAAGLLLLKMENIKIYEGGIDEWISRGLPVEEVENQSSLKINLQHPKSST